MAESLANLSKNDGTRKPIISGSIPSGTALNGANWTNLKTVTLDPAKRYLVIWQVLFAVTTYGYKGVAFNMGVYEGQSGSECGGANTVAAWIVEGKSSIDLLAYNASGGTVSAVYKIIEL